MPVRIEAGIDWLTFWPDGEDAIRQVEELAGQWQREDIASGGKITPFRFQGCEGWSSASVRLGYSTTKVVLQTSGKVATSIATQLASCTGYASRLDVQCTCYHRQPQPRFASRATRLSPTHRRQNSPYPILVGHSSRSDGLRIGTVGRRTKPRYLRVYDKGIEEGTAAKGLVWRLEVEAKKMLARRLWDDFKGSEDRATWPFRHCEAQWRSAGCYWPLPSSEQLPAISAATVREERPADALLRWLRTSVRPAMPRLLRACDTAEVLEALGLDFAAIPRPRFDDHA